MIRLNLLLLAFLTVFALRSAVQLILYGLNASFLRREGDRVPDVFRDRVDPDKLKKISGYTADSARISMTSSLFTQALSLAFVLSGFLPWLVEALQGRGLGLISGGLVFFALLSFAMNLLHLPFNLYDTFVIEERYGFNRMTFKMWASDLAKGLALSIFLGGAAPMGSASSRCPRRQVLVGVGLDPAWSF